jgi:hypothetical protein
MKAKLFAASLLVITGVAPVSANDAYIKVDANGKAIGGAIVCTADVCGDPNSTYSKLTLQPGERYVLQFKGDPVTGNVAGIPATDPNVTLKVNAQTNEWTKTTTIPLSEPTTVIVNQAPVTVTAVQTEEKWNPTVVEVKPTPTPTPTPKPTVAPITETTTVTTAETVTVTTAETVTVTSGETATVQSVITQESTTSEEEPVLDWFTLFSRYLDDLWLWISAFLAEVNK